jgi:hypothetical protein
VATDSSDERESSLFKYDTHNSLERVFGKSHNQKILVTYQSVAVSMKGTSRNSSRCEEVRQRPLPVDQQWVHGRARDTGEEHKYPPFVREQLGDGR